MDGATYPGKGNQEPLSLQLPLRTNHGLALLGWLEQWFDSVTYVVRGGQRLCRPNKDVQWVGTGQPAVLFCF